MARGFKTGGGSRKGSPNKTTAKCREVIAMIADGMAPEFEAWLRRTAEGDPDSGLKPDPKGAADLYLKAIEYHVPKLARTELTGDPDSPLEVRGMDERQLDARIAELMAKLNA